MEMQPDLAAWLELADQSLANQNIPVSDRVLLSIRRLVEWEAIMDENGDPYPLDPATLLQNDWFFPLAKMLGRWYSDRYGDSARTVQDGDLKAFVLIRSTPFLIAIPRHRVESGEEIDTAWMHFSDRVRDDEDPVAWIVRPPNLEVLSQESKTELNADLLRVGNAIRFIYIAAMSVPTAEQPELLSFLRAIVPHLTQAASMIGEGRAQALLTSYWELQMAAESAVKALELRTSGDYSKTHDLQRLARDVLQKDPSFPANTLMTFPDQHRVVDMRYGMGVTPSWDECFNDYCAILEFIRSCLQRLPRIGIGNASLLLKKPDWISG